MTTLTQAILELNDYSKLFNAADEFTTDVKGITHFLFCGDLCTGKSYEQLKDAGIRNIYIGIFSRYNESRPAPIYLYLVIGKLSATEYCVKKSNVNIPLMLYAYLQKFHPEYKEQKLMQPVNPQQTYDVSVFINKQSNKPLVPELRLLRFKELLEERKLPLGGSMGRPESAHLLHDSEVSFIVLDIDLETKTAKIAWLNPDIQINPANVEVAIAYMHDEHDISSLNYAFIQPRVDYSMVSHDVAPSLYAKQLFDYPVAMRAVLDGRAVSRKAWGTMKFISFTPAQKLAGSLLWSKYNRAAAGPATDVLVHGNITLNDAGQIYPYFMSNEDLTATDWCICDWVERRHETELRDAAKGDCVKVDVMVDAIETES